MCNAQAHEVDHLDGCDYETQRYDFAWLRSLCTPCHRTRTARQGIDARARRRTHRQES